MLLNDHTAKEVPSNTRHDSFIKKNGFDNGKCIKIFLNPQNEVTQITIQFFNYANSYNNGKGFE